MAKEVELDFFFSQKFKPTNEAYFLLPSEAIERAQRKNLWNRCQWNLIDFQCVCATYSRNVERLNLKLKNLSAKYWLFIKGTAAIGRRFNWISLTRMCHKFDWKRDHKGKEFASAVKLIKVRAKSKPNTMSLPKRFFTQPEAHNLKFLRQKKSIFGISIVS